MASERCARCSDDGWVEVFDNDDNVVGAQDCPHLGESWHRPFNASGLLGPALGGSIGDIEYGYPLALGLAEEA